MCQPCYDALNPPRPCVKCGTPSRHEFCAPCHRESIRGGPAATPADAQPPCYRVAAPPVDAQPPPRYVASAAPQSDAQPPRHPAPASGSRSVAPRGSWRAARACSSAGCSNATPEQRRCKPCDQAALATVAAALQEARAAVLRAETQLQALVDALTLD